MGSSWHSLHFSHMPPNHWEENGSIWHFQIANLLQCRALCNHGLTGLHEARLLASVLLQQQAHGKNEIGSWCSGTNETERHRWYTPLDSRRGVKKKTICYTTGKMKSYSCRYTEGEKNYNRTRVNATINCSGGCKPLRTCHVMNNSPSFGENKKKKKKK